MSLASVKSRLVLPVWYQFTRVVQDKGPLNGCVTAFSRIHVYTLTYPNILYTGGSKPGPLAKHTHIHNRLTTLSRITWAGQYQKKHSPTHIYLDHQTYYINFHHLLQSTASSLFNFRAWQSFSTSLQVLFGLPLGLKPSTSYSIHFCTQSLSSFRNTCPYHCNLFCCSTEIRSSIPNLSLSSLLGHLSSTLMPHIHFLESN